METTIGPQSVYPDYPYNLLTAIRGNTTLELPHSLTKDVLAGLHYALSTLEDRERTIILGRFQEALSLEDLAMELDISDERVRQLQVKALRKLREPCRWNYISLGIAGYCKSRATAEYNRGFSKGYAEGYRHGRIDQENNVDYSYGPEDLLAQPIEYLNLSTRAQQCLFYRHCETVGDAVRLSEETIRTTRNLGKKSADEIARKLRAAGAQGSDWDQFLL